MADQRDTGEGKFSAAERAAMKQRAAELRAEGKAAKGAAKREQEAQACADAIAALSGLDREIAELLHRVMTEEAPQLAPKTWYGMPAYANADGKVVLSLKNSGKFGQRYSSLEFQDSAHLDDGDVWPIAYALQQWTPAVEKKVVELVKAAVS
jgi:uncharacterized protein YdhG (YjbR/CyaY superfamily)